MKAVLFIVVALALCVNCYAVMSEEQLEDQALLLEASKNGWGNAVFKAQLLAAQRARDALLKAGSGFNPAQRIYKGRPQTAPQYKKVAVAQAEAAAEAAPGRKRGVDSVVGKINWGRMFNKMVPPVPTLSAEQLKEAKAEIKADAKSSDFIAAAKEQLAKEAADKKEEAKKENAFEVKEAKLEAQYNQEMNQVQKQIKSYEAKEMDNIQEEEKRQAAIAKELVTAKPLELRPMHNPFATPKPVIDEVAYQKAESQAEQAVKKYEQAEAASIKQEMKREASIAKELNQSPHVKIAPAHNPFVAAAVEDEDD